MTCYRKSNAQIQASNASLATCGSATQSTIQTCCSAGDQCLGNGICHYNEPSDGGSGYYLAGCTDPSFKDPACIQACTDLPFQDVVFNFSSGLWECCGNQHACGAPVSNETFQALPPSQLQVIGTAAPNAASSATQSPTAAPLLSPIAAGGIGAGAAVIVVLAIVLAVWQIMACKRQRRARQSPPLPTHDCNSFGGYGTSRGASMVSADSKRRFLDSYPRVYHVDGGVKRELEG